MNLDLIKENTLNMDLKMAGKRNGTRYNRSS
jgi:hypothetical protein